MKSILVCTAISIFYVLGLYILTPYVSYLNRDEMVSIRQRMTAASIITIFLVATMYYQYDHSVETSVPFFHAIGFRSDRNTLYSVVSVFWLMSLFYLGPLVTKLAFLTTFMWYDVKSDGMCTMRKTTVSWVQFKSAYLQYSLSLSDVYVMTRNLVLAPISEEIVFRALIVMVLRPSFKNPWVIVFISPLFFSPAHVHHAFVKHWSGVPVDQILPEAILQLVYTYIFGCIATLLLLRTGNIAAPIACHTICNCAQLPDLSFTVPPGQGYSVFSVLHKYSNLLLVLHAMGLVLFACFVLPLTEAYAEVSLFWHSV